MKVRRKIVALGMALSLAFVLVAALLPANVAQAEKYQVVLYDDGSIEEPGMQGKNKILRMDNDYKADSISVDASTKTVTFKNFSCDGMDVDADGWKFVFEGTNSLNKRLAAESDPYVVDTPVTVNLSLKQNATLTAEKFYGKFTLAEGTTSTVDISNADGVKATVSGPSGGGTDPTDPTDPTNPTDDPQTPATTEVKTLQNGESATLNPAADGTVSFRIEKEFEHFQNGGKLYIDGQEVPTDQYYATPGSTIITLVKEYAAKLSDGLDHAVKVVFDDGEFNATIKVSPASSDSTAANGTSGTASSTAATTTKVTSPKTADVLPIAGIALVFVGATAIGVIAIRRKNL